MDSTTEATNQEPVSSESDRMVQTGAKNVIVLDMTKVIDLAFAEYVDRTYGVGSKLTDAAIADLIGSDVQWGKSLVTRAQLDSMISRRNSAPSQPSEAVEVRQAASFEEPNRGFKMKVLVISELPKVPIFEMVYLKGQQADIFVPPADGHFNFGLQQPPSKQTLIKYGRDIADFLSTIRIPIDYQGPVGRDEPVLSQVDVAGTRDPSLVVFRSAFKDTDATTSLRKGFLETGDEVRVIRVATSFFEANKCQPTPAIVSPYAVAHMRHGMELFYSSLATIDHAIDWYKRYKIEVATPHHRAEVPSSDGKTIELTTVPSSVPFGSAPPVTKDFVDFLHVFPAMFNELRRTPFIEAAPQAFPAVTLTFEPARLASIISTPTPGEAASFARSYGSYMSSGGPRRVTLEGRQTTGLNWESGAALVTLFMYPWELIENNVEIVSDLFKSVGVNLLAREAAAIIASESGYRPLVRRDAALWSRSNVSRMRDLIERARATYVDMVEITDMFRSYECSAMRVPRTAYDALFPAGTDTLIPTVLGAPRERLVQDSKLQEAGAQFASFVFDVFSFIVGTHRPAARNSIDSDSKRVATSYAITQIEAIRAFFRGGIPPTVEWLLESDKVVRSQVWSYALYGINFFKDPTLSTSDSIMLYYTPSEFLLTYDTYVKRVLEQTLFQLVMGAGVAAYGQLKRHKPAKLIVLYKELAIDILDKFVEGYDKAFAEKVLDYTRMRLNRDDLPAQTWFSSVLDGRQVDVRGYFPSETSKLYVIRDPVVGISGSMFVPVTTNTEQIPVSADLLTSLNDKVIGHKIRNTEDLLRYWPTVERDGDAAIVGANVAGSTDYTLYLKDPVTIEVDFSDRGQGHMELKTAIDSRGRRLFVTDSVRVSMPHVFDGVPKAVHNVLPPLIPLLRLSYTKQDFVVDNAKVTTSEDSIAPYPTDWIVNKIFHVERFTGCKLEHVALTLVRLKERRVSVTPLLPSDVHAL